MPHYRYNGPEYVPSRDNPRLDNQHARVKHVMMDGRWRTLAEIAELTDDPPASISAQLRHLRKPRFGGWIVERRPRGDRSGGLYEYRVVPPIRPPRPKRQRATLKRRCKRQRAKLKGADDES